MVNLNFNPLTPIRISENVLFSFQSSNFKRPYLPKYWSYVLVPIDAELNVDSKNLFDAFSSCDVISTRRYFWDTRSLWVRVFQKWTFFSIFVALFFLCTNVIKSSQNKFQVIWSFFNPSTRGSWFTSKIYRNTKKILKKSKIRHFWSVLAVFLCHYRFLTWL